MLAPAPRADLRTLRPAPPLSPRSARTHPSPRPSRVSSAGPSVGCVVPSCSPQRPRGTSLPRGKQAGRRRAGRHCMSETPIEAKPFTAHLAANSDPPRGKQPFTASIHASHSRPASRQTATRRAANSRLQPASPPAVHGPPRGKQRPAARQTATDRPRAFRARFALAARSLRAARAARGAVGTAQPARESACRLGKWQARLSNNL